jgi:hypothetical protein
MHMQTGADYFHCGYPVHLAARDCHPWIGQRFGYHLSSYWLAIGMGLQFKPRWLFTSAVLRHLASGDSELPDIVLNRGSAAVPECKNPDLVPEMYPAMLVPINSTFWI